METMRQRIRELTPRQEQLLKRVRELPIPSVPPLDSRALTHVPPWVRWGGILKAFSVSALLGLIALFFHPVVPEILPGPVPWKAGSSLELMAGKTWKVALPSVHGLMIVDGPASVELKQSGRLLFSGRFEAEMVLNRGELFLQADSSSPKIITIKTPLMEVRLTGTQILVGHLPQQGSRLLVKHGMVWVKRSTSLAAWEPLGEGLVLKVTPEGIVQREPLRKEVISKDVKKSAESSSEQAVPSDLKTDPSELPQLWEMVWHED